MFSLGDQKTTSGLQTHVEEESLGTKHRRHTRSVLPRRARSSRVADNGIAIYRTSPHRGPSMPALTRQRRHRCRHPGGHAAAAPSTLHSPAGHSVMLRVTGIDQLFARAKTAGARVFAEPTDQMYGERQCSFADPWGRPWTLSETIFDSNPSDWGGELLVK